MSSVHQRPLPFPPFSKVCPHCHAELPLDAFSSQRNAKDGKHSWCKPCMAARKRERRMAGPEHEHALARARYLIHRTAILAYMREYYIATREHQLALKRAHRIANPNLYKDRDRLNRQRNAPAIRARQQAYQTAHRARLRTYYKQYRQQHRAVKDAQGRVRYERLKDQIREAQRQYNAAHPEILAARNARRRFREQANGGNFTPAEWNALCARYGNRCLACGAVDRRLTVDHVVPVARGGSNAITNIQPLCLRCNQRKKDKHIDYR